MKKRIRCRVLAMCAAALLLTGCDTGSTAHLTVDSHVEEASQEASTEDNVDIVYSSQSERPVPDCITVDELNERLDELGFWKNEELSTDTDDPVELDAATAVNIFYILTEYDYAETEMRCFGDGLNVTYYRTRAGYDSDGNELDATQKAYAEFLRDTQECQECEEFDDAHHYASFVNEDGENTVIVHAYDVMICVSSGAHDLASCEAVMDYLVCAGEAPELVRYPVRVEIITSEE